MINFISPKAYGYVHTAIGKMYVCCGANSSAFFDDLDNPIDNCVAAESVRKFTRYICFLKSSLRDGKYKPDNPVLTNEDVASFTETNLEAIAKIYIEHSEHLFKKSLKGKIGEYGDIEYPREENESYVEYLVRLIIREDKESKEWWEKIRHHADPFSQFRKQHEKFMNALKFPNPFLQFRKQHEKFMNALKSPIRLQECLKKSLNPFNLISSHKPVEKSPLVFEPIKPLDLGKTMEEVMDDSADKIISGMWQTVDQVAKDLKKYSLQNRSRSFIIIGLMVLNFRVEIVQAIDWIIEVVMKYVILC